MVVIVAVAAESGFEVAAPAHRCRAANGSLEQASYQ